MKKLINGYRSYFEIPDSVADSVIKARLFTFLVLFFILGLAVGRFIRYFI